MLISDKVNCRRKNIIKDNEKRYTMTKSLTHQEDIVILNVYAPNNRASKHIKQNL